MRIPTTREEILEMPIHLRGDALFELNRREAALPPPPPPSPSGAQFAELKQIRATLESTDLAELDAKIVRLEKALPNLRNEIAALAGQIDCEAPTDGQISAYVTLNVKWDMCRFWLKSAPAKRARLLSGVTAGLRDLERILRDLLRWDEMRPPVFSHPGQGTETRIDNAVRTINALLAESQGQ